MSYRLLPALAMLSMASTAVAAARTLRVDYYHSGNATQELFSLDRVVVEPLEWPGQPEKTTDRSNLGKYFFEVRDPSGRVLYSRGFASVYGEWETTAEAARINRTFHESFRFPTPDTRVAIVLRKRDSRNVFRDIWTIEVDPKDTFVDTSSPPAPGALIELQKSGDPASKVDVLLLGDGYTASERGKFERDARRMIDILFATSPFKERRADFNVWGLVPAAAVSGISRPSTGVHVASPVGATYDAFGSERYVLSFNNRAMREIAAFAPYEFIEILTNSRTYGGGGIFNLYSTVAADSEQAPYVFVHEFAHHFAALADEYYTSPVAYAPAPAQRIEPWEPNVTALLDPKSLKWRDLVTPGTPLPTRWRKEEFEQASRAYQERRAKLRAANRPEEEMEALFRESRAFEVALFAKDPSAGRVGAFEGANYEASGYFRPELDCIMFTRSATFCAVCRRALETIIDLYT
jgi:IgA Peptidase M64/Peptidase M64 N-terminus